MLMSGVTLDHANAPAPTTKPAAAAMSHLGRRTTTSLPASPGRMETIACFGGGVLDLGRALGGWFGAADAAL
jgi:hypothetical protein